MAKCGKLLTPEQAKSVLLAYLASDSADGYLKMTFIHDDDGYIEVKVSEPNKWRLKQRVTWEQHNGPLKDGELVWFRDNDRLNCEIDNLMVVTRAQHAVVNKMGLHGATGDLKTTSVLIADLSMARTKRSKQPKVAA